MSKTFILITLLFFSFGCSNEIVQKRREIQNDLRTYFTENLKDSSSVLDSFLLVKIDTISQRTLLYEQSSVLTNQLKYLIEMLNINTESMGYSVDQIRLYRLIGSSELIEIEKRDFEKKKEKGDKVKAEIDTVMKVIKKINSTAAIADSILPVGFQAKCLYQLRFKDKSIEKDTVHILLNAAEDIVKRKDFLKLPYEVNYNLLD